MRKLILTCTAALMIATPAAAAPKTLMVALLNLDEAALIVKGPGGTRTARVGAKLTLQAKGVYRITMVKQAPDDNHLKLTIK
jgi:hypothetical protein